MRVYCKYGLDIYSKTIPTAHHYAYFAQFDWLMNIFYTSINSMHRNLGTILNPPAPYLSNTIGNNKILMKKLELYIRNE